MVSERCLWETTVKATYWDCEPDVRNKASWEWGEMGCQ